MFRIRLDSGTRPRVFESFSASWKSPPRVVVVVSTQVDAGQGDEDRNASSNDLRVLNGGFGRLFGHDAPTEKLGLRTVATIQRDLRELRLHSHSVAKGPPASDDRR